MRRAAEGERHRGRADLGFRPGARPRPADGQALPDRFHVAAEERLLRGQLPLGDASGRRRDSVRHGRSADGRHGARALERLFRAQAAQHVSRGIDGAGPPRQASEDRGRDYG